MCERVLENSRYTKQTSILPHIFKLCIYLRLFHVSVFSVLSSMCICRSVFVSLSIIPLGIYLITSFHHTNIVATRTTIKLSNRLSQNTKLWGKRRWKNLWWITLSWPSMQRKQTLTQTMLKREDFLQDSLGCRPQLPSLQNIYVHLHCKRGEGRRKLYLKRIMVHFLYFDDARHLLFFFLLKSALNM